MGDAVHGLILVIDDNAENRALAQASLEDEGYRVTLATTGAEGLEAFGRQRPDCVLLDIRMPGMDGITACRRLRALPGGSGVPVLFVTAQRDLDTFDRAHDAGGDDFIMKPYRPSELVGRVATAIKLQRLSVERGELVALGKRQRDDLLRLQLRKEQLVAFLVHDLKNPVNAIRLHGERILRDHHASERSRDAAAKIQAETRALTRMIMSLLDVSKADEGRLVPVKQQLEPGALIREVVDEMSVSAQAAQVALVTSGAAPALACDPELMRRVLENLVDNAIRHSPEDSTVRIELAAKDAGVAFRIADEGVGIPDPLKAEIFERFVQGGRDVRGHGLGLAFCRLAVEAHGGRIWIDDATPGAVFCFWMPDV